MSLAHPTKKEVVSEFRRAGILKAARKVFAKRGYEGATMDDVAEASSMAKGTLYLYFKSKRQIYIAVLKQDLELLRQSTRMAIAAASSPAAKIRAFVTARVDFCENHRDFFRIYSGDLTAMIALPQASEREVRDFYSEQAEMLAAIIKDGIKAGEVRKVPALEAAFAIYDVTRALISRRILGLATAASGEAEAQVVIDLLWRGIGAEPAHV